MADDKLKSTHYWSTFLPRLGEKAVDEAISAVYFENEPLNRWLRTHMTGTPERHGLMADSVFEACFPSKVGSKTMKQLAQYKLLHPKTVEIVGTALERPYAHQQRAFEILCDRSRRNSVLISSGTGSGKTECFMVPLLDDCIRELEAGERRKGIRALFIYPLNALIESQQERLSSWLGPLNGRVRFVRYNGDLPERPKAGAYQGHPEEITDREDMRRSVPDIMLSNPSMLERMILRKKDAHIIAETRKSKSFRWIIIDEAHTYVGARAAELALLLRRILNAFGVNPRDVHFVLTSATVDATDELALERLKTFLRDISGTDPENVHLVLGQADVPPEMPTEGLTTERRAEEILLENVDWTNDALRDRLARSEVAVRIRNAFITKRHMRLSELRTLLGGMAAKDVLSWLDLLSSVMPSAEGGPFLPLRLHQMLNSTGPLMACPDRHCPAKDAELQDPAWRFGQVWLDGRQTCACGAPLLPLAACRSCNSVGLRADHVFYADGTEGVEPPRDLDNAEKRWNIVETSGHADTAADPEEEPDEDVENQDADEGDGPLSMTRHACIVTNADDGVEYSVYASRRVLSDDAGESEGFEVLVRFPDDEAESWRLVCPNCGDSAPLDRWFVRRVSHRYAQFLLPFVLQYGGEQKAGLPMMGNRLISFTDSRDGTATSGALLEREGEHAFVERILVSMLRKPAEPKIDWDMLANLKKMGVQISEEQLQALSEPQVRLVPLKDLVDEVNKALLNLESLTQLKQSYQALRVNIEEAGQILVLRELGFRPVNGASLENCGLVTLEYEGLQLVGENVPGAWPKAYGPDGWRIFLKHFIDFFLRLNHILTLPVNWPKAGGDRNVWSKTVYSPKNVEAKAGRTTRLWPRVNRRSPANSQRIIRYLAALLDIDLTRNEPSKWDLIDELSTAAFNALRNARILEEVPGEGGTYYVDLLQKAKIRLNKKGYAFKGVHSLVGDIIGSEEKAVSPLRPDVRGAVAVDIPQPVPESVWETGSNLATREAVEGRVAADPAYRALLDKGLWNRLGTYALMEYGYFAAAEHSAQVETGHRTLYVENFKKGLVNVLSCTTTMEMGVDIGGFNTVFMNGVPPHPANYLQRAGRAGRRSETRMNALTLCRPRTRDQEVFGRPDWALTERQTSVCVSLQSSVLVGRHVNAQIVGFWCLQTKVDPEELTVGQWIGQGASEPASVTFNRWLDELDGKDQETLRSSIATIVRYSVLEGVPFAEQLARCRRQLDELTKTWVDTNTRFVALVKAYTGNQGVLAAVQNQLERFRGEKLYDMLTQENVFPSSVRIVNVISFKNTPPDAKVAKDNKKNKQTKGTEENKPISLPNRPGHYAVHEYAPGASVLIDGKVYESAGLTLAWHSPTTKEGLREIQQFTQLCHCRTCGCEFKMGYEFQHLICPSCGSSDLDVVKALMPKGFATDEYSKVHNDFGHRFIYPKRESTVTIEDVWVPLGSESGLLFKSSPNALVLSRNDGRYGKGFAVCLHCGWSRPEPKEDDDEQFEKSILEHYPIREGASATKPESRGFCHGARPDQPYLVQRHVALAASSRTDALSLRFEGVGRIFRDRRDAKAAEILRGAMTGIAVALRHVIAQHFFVDDAEIDFSVGPLRDGAIEISLFDAGMCGYTSSVAGLMPTFLREARTLLAKCPNDCPDACSACIVSYDAEWHSRHLNRFDSMRVLTEDRLASLDVEEELRGLAGRDTVFFNRDLFEHLLSQTRVGRLEAVTLLCHGVPSEDVAVHLSDVVRLASRLSHAGVRVTLAAEGFSWKALSADLSSQMSLMGADVDFAEVHEADVKDVPLRTLVAESRGVNGERQAYAVKDADLLTDWRFPSVDVPVYAGHLPEALAVRSCSAPKWAAVEPTVFEAGSAVIRDFEPVSLRTDNAGALVLDAAAKALGRRSPAELLGEAQVQEVVYSDRYVERIIDPVLVLSLFAGVSSSLTLSPEVRFAMVMAAKVNDTRNCRNVSRITSLWDDYATRDRILSQFQLWMKTGELWNGCPQARLAIRTLPKAEVPHHRRLTVLFTDGRKLHIGFDRGVSFLDLTASRQVNLKQTEQTAKLLRLYLDPAFATMNGMLSFNPDEAVMSVWLEEPESQA